VYDHAVAVEDDSSIPALLCGDASVRELLLKRGFLRGAERLDAGDGGHFMPAGGEGFHQKAVRLVATSVGWKV